MKLIILKGKYGFKKKLEYEGLIVMFQFERKDNSEQYKMAAKAILDEARDNDIILVPFSHISNDVKPYDEAKKYSNEFKEFCVKNKINGNIHLIPFGIQKELHLSSNGIAFVKFKEF